MKKTYKPRKIKMITDVISVLFGVLFILIIVGQFLEVKYVLIIGIAIMLWYLLSVMKDQKLLVEVDSKNLFITLKGKQEVFPIDECDFNFKSVNNTDFTLYIVYKEKKYSYDLSLLSLKDVNNLLYDLKIIGDKSEVIKLKVKGE